MAKYVLEFERPILELEEKITEMRSLSGQLDLGEEIELLEQKVEQLRASIYERLTRWQRVQLARHPERPFMLDYVAMMCEDFLELQARPAAGHGAAAPSPAACTSSRWRVSSASESSPLRSTLTISPRSSTTSRSASSWTWARLCSM